MSEQVDARRQRYAAADALAIVDEVDEIYAAKGKSVVHFDLKKQRPDDDALLQVLLGPTGNLRAPTLRKGKTLLVGFDKAMYERIFK